MDAKHLTLSHLTHLVLSSRGNEDLQEKGRKEDDAVEAGMDDLEVNKRVDEQQVEGERHQQLPVALEVARVKDLGPSMNHQPADDEQADDGDADVVRGQARHPPGQRDAERQRRTARAQVRGEVPSDGGKRRGEEGTKNLLAVDDVRESNYK